MNRRRRGAPVSATGLVSWLWRPAWRRGEVGWGGIALAAILSVWAIGLVSGVIVTKPHSGVAAAIVVLAMMIRVVWQLCAPLAAAAAVAVGAALNEVLIGPMVRCGPGLPAVFVIAFFAATRLDRRRLALAVALCLAAVTLQSFFDPKLRASFLVAGVPIVLASCLAGRLARSRSRAAAALRERNAEAQESSGSRPRSWRWRPTGPGVAGDLDEFLRDRITAMGKSSGGGRTRADHRLIRRRPRPRSRRWSTTGDAVADARGSGHPAGGVADRPAAGPGPARQPAEERHHVRRATAGRGQCAGASGGPGALGLPDRRAPARGPAGRAGRSHRRAGAVLPRMRSSWTWPGRSAATRTRWRRSRSRASGSPCWAGRCGLTPARSAGPRWSGCRWRPTMHGRERIARIAGSGRGRPAGGTRAQLVPADRAGRRRPAARRG